MAPLAPSGGTFGTVRWLGTRGNSRGTFGAAALAQLVPHSAPVGGDVSSNSPPPTKKELGPMLMLYN